MPQPAFRDEQWQRVYAFLKACSGIYVGSEAATRRFVEAVLWMARAGCAWRLVPSDIGKWNSVYKRFARWQEKGVWQALLDHLAADADLEWVMIDSTVVRAHACAAGAKKPKAIRPSAARVAAFPASCTALPTASATR
jgi:putative transposase